jgi:hypothetical protein
MEFGTHTKKNMLSLKTTKTRSVQPFSKIAAAAISKINETLQVGHLSQDFDESWYTYQDKHAESMKIQLILPVRNSMVLRP